MKTIRHFILAAILTLAVQALWCANCRADDLVDFTLTDFVTKQQVCSSAYRGKCMLIIFGSIYCKPCVEMLPVVRQVRDKYESEGLVVIGIDIDMTSEEEKIAHFIKNHQIRHLYLIDTIRVARQNKVFTLPTTLIVNPRGGIEKRLLGFYDYEKLDRIVKKILADTKG